MPLGVFKQRIINAGAAMSRGEGEARGGTLSRCGGTVRPPTVAESNTESSGSHGRRVAGEIPSMAPSAAMVICRRASRKTESRTMLFTSRKVVKSAGRSSAPSTIRPLVLARNFGSWSRRRWRSSAVRATGLLDGVGILDRLTSTLSSLRIYANTPQPNKNAPRTREH